MATLVTLTNNYAPAPVFNLAAVQVTVDANSVSYATSLGGLALDLYAVLNAATPFGSPIPKIMGCQPLGRTSGGFLPYTLTVGTVTSTSIPCFVRFVATGTSGSAGFAEIADAVCTQTVSFLVLVARGGTN